MSILTEPLPEAVEIGGRAWAIRSAFYIGINFELLMQSDRADEEKLRQALSLYYPELPPDTGAAIDRLLWFYRCGVDPAESGGGAAGGTRKKAYDFEQDAALIYAAFQSAYGIDLAEEELHWWKFRALFRGLPSECELVKAMGYRTADLSGLSKAQRKHYEKMRSLYALRDPRHAGQAISLAGLNQRRKDHVAKLFEQAQAAEQEG